MWDLIQFWFCWSSPPRFDAQGCKCNVRNRLLSPTRTFWALCTPTLTSWAAPSVPIHHFFSSHNKEWGYCPAPPLVPMINSIVFTDIYQSHHRVLITLSVSVSHKWQSWKFFKLMAIVLRHFGGQQPPHWRWWWRWQFSEEEEYNSVVTAVMPVATMA